MTPVEELIPASPFFIQNSLWSNFAYDMCNSHKICHLHAVFYKLFCINCFHRVEKTGNSFICLETNELQNLVFLLCAASHSEYVHTVSDSCLICSETHCFLHFL